MYFTKEIIVLVLKVIVFLYPKNKSIKGDI